jgi:two-component system C4-dicarboxylate transport sensor histidine kinase DctB
MIDARATLDAPRWTLTVRRDVGDAVRTARNIGWLTAGLLGALLTLILGTILVARERRERTQRELESLVEQRTEELRNSNQRLVLEIDERARADARVQKLRDDLVQANRLAVLGQISAGVAHEINQPVAAIRTNVDNAAVLLARGRQTECEENLRAIVSLTDRIGLITDELREFARRTPIERKPTRLAAAIDGACILLDARLRSASITLHKNLSPTDPQVIANRTKIEQVIVNLLQNAIEALADTSMPTITIETGSSATGHWIAIRDNGPGIPDAQRDELFVPFSSTKPLGLGLGLVICRDIMADLGGTLDFESVAGPGARFVARFPAREIA